MFWSYYSMMVFLAFCSAASYFVYSFWKKRLPNLTWLILLSLFFAPFALIGARLWNYLNWVHLQEIIEQGSWINQLGNFFGFGPEGLRGLSFFGGFFATLLYFLALFTWYGKKYQVSLWVTFDVLLQAVLIFQIIGRWGNFFNQELLGPVITMDYPQDFGWIPNWFGSKLHFPGESIFWIRHPLFLYESFANFWLLVLLILAKRLGIIYLFWTTSRFPILQKQIFLAESKFKKTIWPGFFFWYQKWTIVKSFWQLNIYWPQVNFNHTPSVTVNDYLWKWKQPVVSKLYQKELLHVSQISPFYWRFWRLTLLFLFQRNSTSLVGYFNPQKLVVPWVGHTSALYCLGYGLIRFFLQILRENIILSEPTNTPYYASALLFFSGCFFLVVSQLIAPYKWRNPNWFYETWYWKI